MCAEKIYRETNKGKVNSLALLLLNSFSTQSWNLWSSWSLSMSDQVVAEKGW